MNGTMQKTILLVEDEAFIAIMEKKQLEKEGYRVITASGGIKAIDIIRSGNERIDLILMDIDLGHGIDGTETALEILQTHDIPIVFLSSHTEKEIVQKTENITSYGYVVKNTGIIVLDASIKMAFKLFEAKYKENEKNTTLRESEERFRSIVENVPVGMFQSTPEGRIIYVNPSFAQIFGYTTPGELIHVVNEKSVAEVLYEDPSLRPVFVQQVEDEIGNWKVFENSYRHRDGRIITGFLSFCERMDPVTGSNILYGFVQDITENKKNLEELKESRNFLMSIIDQSPFPMWISDDKGTLIKINRACCELLNITHDDVTGVYNILEDEIVAAQGHMPLVKKVFEEGEIVNFEINYNSNELKHLNLKNTVSVILDVTISPIINSNGLITNAVIQHKDITERRKTENALQLSELHFRRLSEDMPCVICTFLPDSTILYANRELSMVTGLSREELTGQKFFDFLGPEEFGTIKSGLDSLTPENPVESHEQVHILPDGSKQYLNWRNRAFFDESGKAMRFTGVAIDITAQKHAEGKLNDTMMMLETAQDIANIGFWKLEVDGIKLDWSSGLKTIFGLKKDEPVPSYNEFLNFVYPDDRGFVREQSEMLLNKKGENHFIYIYRIISADGKLKYLEHSGCKAFDTEGKLLRVYGSVQDVTERTLADMELKRSREMLDITQSAAGAGSWHWDIVTGELKWSALMFELFGIDQGKYSASIITWRSVIHPDDREQAEENITRAIENHENLFNEYRIIIKNGSVRWINALGKCYYNEHGHPVWMSGICFDITERKSVEHVLHENETRYRELFNNISSGVAIYEAINNGNDFIFRDFNKAGERIDNESRENVIGRSILDVRPGVREFGLFDVLKRVWETGIPEYFPLSQYKDNRLTGWYENYVYRLPSGEIVAVFDNLTKQKQKDEALRESENHFRTLADSGQALIWTAGLDMKCNYFNRPWLEFTGRTIEQESGDGWTEGVHPDDLKRCVEIYVYAFRLRVKFSMEYRLRHNSGVYRWIQDDGTPRYSNNGEFIGYIGHCLDITQHKQAETEIQNLLREKEIILKEVNHRVKNNMNTISGLLTLQADTCENDEIKDILLEAAGRVQSMKVLYERLYRSETNIEMSLRDYMVELVYQVKNIFAQKKSVRINTQIDDFNLNVKILSPLGIIINELITNSMKYAFTGRDDGIISIKISITNDHAAVLYKDNGIGMPENIDFNNTSGFGLQLVDMLVKQLNGVITIDRVNGSGFRMKFKV